MGVMEVQVQTNSNSKSMESLQTSNGQQDGCISESASQIESSRSFSGANPVGLISSTVVNQRAFANNCGIPIGALIDLQPSSALGLPQVQHPPVRCTNCLGFMNSYCRTNLSKHVWKCNFCGLANLCKEQLANPDVLAYQELCSEAVEYVAPAPPPPTDNQHLALLIDATLDPVIAQNLSTAIKHALATLPPTMLVSVITVDSAVAIHHLGEDTRYSLVVPGSKAVDPALLQKVVGGSNALLAAPLSECRAQVESVVDSIRPFEQHKHSEGRARCLGAGLEVALRLVVQQAQINPNSEQRLLGSRVMAFIGGPCNLGPGTVPAEAVVGTEQLTRDSAQAVKDAEEYMGALASMACKVGVVVDVFSAVSTGHNVPLLTLLTQGTSGDLMRHKDFGPLMPDALTAALHRRFGVDGVLDCYVSDGLRLVQWIGPVDPVKGNEPAPAAERWRTSSLACTCSCLDVGRGLALRLELTRDLGSLQAVAVQVVLQYYDYQRRLYVQRVATRRMGVTGSLAEYLPSVNSVAAAVMIGKRLVLQAKKSGIAKAPKKAEELRYAAGAHLNLLASRCGKQVQASSGFLGLGARKHWLLPSELLPIATALYQLQRGQLLGPTSSPASCSHPDERQAVMNALLWAPTSHAYCMMAPQLYCLKQAVHAVQLSQRVPHPELESLLSVDLLAVLYPGRTLVLDHGSTLYVSAPDIDVSAQRPGSYSSESGSNAALPRHVPDARDAASVATVSIADLHLQSSTSHSLANGHTVCHAHSNAAQTSLDAHSVANTAVFLQECKHAARLLLQSRFPVPDMQAAPGAHKAAGALFGKLAPISRDTAREQSVQFPELQQMSQEVVRSVCQSLNARHSEPSFVQWCNGVNVAPFVVDH